jgi:hypothetical protein
MERGADELWAAVADPTRRRLLDVLLARGEATATALAAELPVTRQGVAKHLAVLDRAGLVEGRRGAAKFSTPSAPSSSMLPQGGWHRSPPSGTTDCTRSSASRRRSTSEREVEVLLQDKTAVVHGGDGAVVRAHAAPSRA